MLSVGFAYRCIRQANRASHFHYSHGCSFKHARQIEGIWHGYQFMRCVTQVTPLFYNDKICYHYYIYSGWQLGSLAAWQLGSLAAWQLGSLAAWQLGSLAAWQLKTW
ncbi:hypothetical protein [Pantoea ananatis]|uniref:hypothetical protein n=1 Tax=Pantoea ananas TaxID=553 RepID=UPI0018C75542|nr:hypothetical protein [Pantoea ananatis]